jgi:hypothetical protein
MTLFSLGLVLLTSAVEALDRDHQSLTSWERGGACEALRASQSEPELSGGSPRLVVSARLSKGLVSLS